MIVKFLHDFLLAGPSKSSCPRLLAVPIEETLLFESNPKLIPLGANNTESIRLIQEYKLETNSLFLVIRKESLEVLVLYLL